MNTTHANETDRSDMIRLALLIVFFLFFVATAGYALIRWADEGPDVRYTPPAYTHHHR